jgi:hypothetical protein
VGEEEGWLALEFGDHNVFLFVSEACGRKYSFKQLCDVQEKAEDSKMRYMAGFLPDCCGF